MMLHPTVIALMVGSFLLCVMLLISSAHGVRILRKWDLQSGSELQLELERRTYLVSMLLAYALGFQLVSLFLFIYTADDLHRLFVGAMCAAGTLNVNPFGYPTLVLKVVNFLFAAVWLIMNYADNRAHDYPLIRKKYGYLLVMMPCILAETVLQTLYFLDMKPNVITSCCGTLFSEESSSVTSGIAALPSIPTKIAFYTATLLTIISGWMFWRSGKGGHFFSVVAPVMFVVSVAALISFISLYFYELPTHHCPFDILQREYSYIGYLMYVALLGGGATGIGVGVLMPFRRIESLSSVVPRLQRLLALISSVLYLGFALISTVRMLTTNFRLEGY
ncbi:MAG TPA: hypothetical protein VMM54_06370 [Nitrospirota bacterium]|nr:hypothetical protein [Nitrospirota bacterium]